MSIEEYDGWVVKVFRGETHILCKGFFSYTRKDAIKEFEKLFGEGSWKKKRRKGEVKLVKVKVTEFMTVVEG